MDDEITFSTQYHNYNNPQQILRHAWNHTLVHLMVSVCLYYQSPTTRVQSLVGNAEKVEIESVPIVTNYRDQISFNTLHL